MEFKLVRGKCSVVFSEEFNPERDSFFLKGEDKFYFAEVSISELCPEANFVVCRLSLQTTWTECWI